MSKAKNQHFVPGFLIRKWADSGGLVMCWKRDGASGRVVPFTPTPEAIMAERYLYRAEFVPDWDRYEQAFGEMEGVAAEALRKFLDPEAPTFTPEDYAAWAVFVLAKRARIPRRIAWAKERAREGFEQMLNQPDEEFDRINPDPELRTIGDHIRRYEPEFLPNLPFEALMRSVHSSKNVRALMKLHWFVRRQTSAEVARGDAQTVLLGDDPAIWGDGLDSPRCIVALPISPRAIFFATASEASRERIAGASFREIARTVNHDQAVQAHRFVIGNVKPSFLEKRLRRMPGGDLDLLT